MSTDSPSWINLATCPSHYVLVPNGINKTEAKPQRIQGNEDNEDIYLKLNNLIINQKKKKKSQSIEGNFK